MVVSVSIPPTATEIQVVIVCILNVEQWKTFSHTLVARRNLKYFNEQSLCMTFTLVQSLKIPDPELALSYTTNVFNSV